MSSPQSEHMEQQLADARQRLDSMIDTQRRLGEISCTATAPRQAVTVTVAHGGEVTALKFPTGAYKRMAPAELASVLLDTLAEARRQVLDEAAEVMAPMMPAGVRARDVLSGTADLGVLVAPRPARTEFLRDVLAAPHEEASRG